VAQGLQRTVQHEKVKSWAQARRGSPARVRGTVDALRIALGKSEAQFESIGWEQWFEVFDSKELAFVFETPGYTYKVVRRNGREDGATPAT